MPNNQQSTTITQSTINYHQHHQTGLSIFIEQGVDVVVLEVGIGGRLDATNGAPALHGPRAAPGRVGCL